MMNFFRDIKNSIYNPAYYQTVRQQSFTSSLKYFAKLSVLVACIASIIPIVGILGVLIFKQDTLVQARMGIINAFPQELSIHVQDGKLSTNVDEPYAIPMPRIIRELEQTQEQSQDSAQGMPSGSMPENLVVINTKKPIEIGDFETYHTAAIVSSDYVGIYNQDRGKVELQSLGDIRETHTLDKPMFEILVNKVWKFVFILGMVITALLPFFFFLFFFVGHMVYLVFGALIVWLVLRLMHQRTDYAEAYVLGLHLITLPLLLYALVPFVFFMPLLFTLLLAGITYVNFKQQQTVSVADAVLQDAPSMVSQNAQPNPFEAESSMVSTDSSSSK